MRSILYIFIYLAAFAISAQAGTRRALIFGLGKQQDLSWGKIHGDNDIYYVNQLLLQCGFSDIQTLKNEEATKANMSRAFVDLANRCKKGDVVYIHYSGHGQLMTDLDGDEAMRTTARHGQWDESWIPYDAYMNYCPEDRGEKHFCDDDIALYLSAIRAKIGPKGKLCVTVDACHSGDATCGYEEECVRGVDVKFNIPRTEQKHEAHVQKEAWLTISACKPYQLSTEMKGLNIGKLTFALYSLGSKLFSISVEELQEALEGFMEINKGRVAQNPVVSGKM